MGNPYTGANACGDIAALYSLVAGYSAGPLADCGFSAIRGYNSNSFTYTLVSQVGLLGNFGTPGGPLPNGGLLTLPGWNQIVPGL